MLTAIRMEWITEKQKASSPRKDRKAVGRCLPSFSTSGKTAMASTKTGSVGCTVGFIVRMLNNPN